MDYVKSDVVSQYSSKSIKDLLTTLAALRREKKKFTAKDSVLFEKLKSLNIKFKDFSEKIQVLEKNEEDTKRLIESFDANIQEKISKIFQGFNTYLQRYFTKITGSGKITAKLLKERARGRRGNLNNNNSII